MTNQSNAFGEIPCTICGFNEGVPDAYGIHKCQDHPSISLQRLAVANSLCKWRNGKPSSVPFNELSAKEQNAYFQQADQAIAAYRAHDEQPVELADAGTKLPFDIKIGGVVFRKGISVSTLVNAAERWQKMAGLRMLEGVNIPEAIEALKPPIPEREIVDEARENLVMENNRLSDFLCFVKQEYPEVYPAYKAALKDLAVKLKRNEIEGQS